MKRTTTLFGKTVEVEAPDNMTDEEFQHAYKAYAEYKEQMLVVSALKIREQLIHICSLITDDHYERQVLVIAMTEKYLELFPEGPDVVAPRGRLRDILKDALTHWKADLAEKRQTVGGVN